MTTRRAAVTAGHRWFCAVGDLAGYDTRRSVVARTGSEPLSKLDPRAPLVLDTRELGRRPGSQREVSRTVPAPADLGIEVLGVPEGSPVELDLRLEAVMEGVLVTGRREPARGRVRAVPGADLRRDRGQVPGAVRLRRPERRSGRGARGQHAPGRPGRPGAAAAGRGGARTAVPAVVPGRLSRAVRRVRRPARGRPRPRARRAGRPAVVGAEHRWPSPSRQKTEPDPARARPAHAPRPVGHRRRREQWQSRSGRCRAATPATGARSGRPWRRRW